MQQLGRIILAVAVGGSGGAVFAVLHMPLPWLLGALIAVGACSLSGLRLGLLAGSRQTAQMVIGASIGLYFTPPVAATVASYLPLMVFTALLSVAFGIAAAALLRRCAGIDRVSAFFASVPGGVSEMSIQAERLGGAVQFVALAQSLRVVFTVMTIPPALTIFGVTGQSWFVPTSPLFEPLWLIPLFAAALVSCLLLSRTRMANAWLIGSLIPGLLFAFAELPINRMPTELVNVAQVVLGTALGLRFQREAMRKLRGVLWGAVASTALLVVLIVVSALLLAPLVGLPFPTLLLGMAPGGAPEMSITAKVLGLGVPIVTAFHITRMFVIVTICAPLFHVMEGWSARRDALTPHAGD